MHNEQNRRRALAVRRVLEGATLPAALADRSEAAFNRAFVQELAYGTLRHWGRLTALTQVLAAKPLDDSSPRWSRSRSTSSTTRRRRRLPSSIARSRPPRSWRGRRRRALVNALLRRYLRERDALNDRVVRDSPVARWSYPALVDRARAGRSSAHWEAILAAGNERPPLTLRVNRRVASRERSCSLATRAGSRRQPVGEGRHHRRRAASGDRAAGLCRRRVLRAGRRRAAGGAAARPAGRTCACSTPAPRPAGRPRISPSSPTSISRRSTATEARLARIRDNLERLRLEKGVRVNGGRRGRSVRPGGTAAPSTASSPTSRARRRASSAGTPTASGCGASPISRPSPRSSGACWPACGRCSAPGGLLLYATCSVFDAENELQISRFAQDAPRGVARIHQLSARCAHAGGQLLPSGNAAGHNQDGFFYALLRKA